MNAPRAITLVVTSDDSDVTIARLWLEGLEVTAFSKRERGDTFDAALGEQLAVARALRKMADKLERKANGRMRMLDSIRRHKAEIRARKDRPVPLGLTPKATELLGPRGVLPAAFSALATTARKPERDAG